jgi:hypothetical protein
LITYLPTARPDDTASDVKPLPKRPSRANEYITLFTEADVTWCRPWPNTAIEHTNGAHYYKGTMLNLTCYAHNDIPEPPDGPGLSSPVDIWVKTGDNGCYINENDLKSAEISFEDTLNICLNPPGPYPLGGNRPPTAEEQQAAALPAASNSSSTEKAPPFVVIPRPTDAQPPAAPPAYNNSSPYFENSAPVFPNPSLIPALPLQPSPVHPLQPTATNGTNPSVGPYVPTKAENATKTVPRRRADRSAMKKLV